jgi:hypothetical protein
MPMLGIDGLLYIFAYLSPPQHDALLDAIDGMPRRRARRVSVTFRTVIVGAEATT